MSDLANFESKFRRLAELKEQASIDKKQSERSAQEFRQYEAELMEELGNSGIRGSQTIDFGGDLGTIRFTKRKPTKYGTIIDMEIARAAMEEMHRTEEFLGTKIQEQRLNEFVRGEIEAGRELPPGFGYYERGGITISRINK